ncbi:5'-methylthioadenosine/adenosylhomocysteine nucleosidase [Clostridium sp. LY3-2]|uniref:5'-methylthioadenosine/adenosylhomocysteine nucleosidase n=1 Tax=Clostridium sp. LY3-2 TaxID=2942482 RepID=UPI0021536901|nr:5'-methylthioadenosine/adenosylhomocysteine nucleosidase [Clostridium sp. LY3-2]MCR6514480.1 5'-methylthioadenosine/adenosylhomocysteine nucleosidase [Clostridium sp. LY3-2]
MRIGVIGPAEDEIMPFIDKIEGKIKNSYAMLNFYSGKFEGVDVVALFSGVCKVNAAIATQILIDKFEVTHIIVTGVAGGIDNSLRVGDTVIASQISYHDVETGILTEYHPWMKNSYFKSDKLLIDISKKIVENNKFKQKIYFGKIVTGEAFISDSGRDIIIKNHNPLCVDMETASIAHVCYVNSIPFLAIRSMSDTEEESGNEAFEKNCTLAANNSLNLTELIIRDLK